MEDKRERIEINGKMKELVIARIGAQISLNLRLSIGDGNGLTKEERIDHVKRGDETGRQIVITHMSFIRAIANGEVSSALTSV